MVDFEKSGIKVVVTDEDITNAIRRDSTHCAVAEAIKRHVPEAQGVDVTAQSIRFRIPEQEKRFIFLTPRVIQAYIMAFDAGEELKEFAFTLNHPIWVGPIGVWANVTNNSRVRKPGRPKKGEEKVVGDVVLQDEDEVMGTALITITEPVRQGGNGRVLERKTVVRAPSLPAYTRPTKEREYGGRHLPMNRVVKSKEAAS